MEYRRIEIRRVVRHYENISDENEIKATLQKLLEMKVACTIRVTGYPPLGTSYVLAVGEKIGIFSRDQKVKVMCGVSDIKEIEVFSNIELTEEDHRGRWDFI